MTYNTYNGWQHDPRGLADAMRRVLENRGCEQGGRHHGYYRDEEQEFDAKMEDYFRRLHEGKTAVPNSLCEVMATGIQMYMENAHDGSSHDATHENAEEQHRHYKEAIERLREERDPNVKERMMKEMFPDLTPDEQVVLREEAKLKSYRERAREKWGSNATAERWNDAKKNLKHKYKLKHSA